MRVNEPFEMPVKNATFDSTRTYRYSLVRSWDWALPRILFIGLNPSTADENILDPTVRKCCIWAKQWGFGGMLMGNIYAYRSTDPRGLKTVADPVGERNNAVLIKLFSMSGMTVAAWGAKADPERVAEVMKILSFGDMYCLAKNKDGSPKHPLYIKMDTKPMLYSEKEQ